MNGKNWLAGMLAILVMVSLSSVHAQVAPPDSVPSPFAKGGLYDRPYIARFGGNTAVGGYAEANSNWHRIDGIDEGFSFEARRFNIFLYSSIAPAVKLTSELEFEHGTGEIHLETALVDVLFAVPVNLRIGILLPPIGRFNVQHDSPRYSTIDRPLVSTQIVPATLSEVGLGLFGAWYFSPYDRLLYEAYLVNGLQDGVVLGSGDGVRIPEGKSPEAFEEDNNGQPAFTARLAWNPRFGGELGLSYYGGRYNTHRLEGAPVDDPRSVRLYAIDGEWRRGRWLFRGEAVLATIDVPAGHVDDDLLARKQWGFFFDIDFRLWQGPVAQFAEADVQLFTRIDYIDLNVGRFDRTGESIGDDSLRFTLGLALRPVPDTVLRVSLWRQWDRDVLNNRETA